MKFETFLYKIKLIIDEYLAEANYQVEIVDLEPKAAANDEGRKPIDHRQKRQPFTRRKGEYPRSYEDMVVYVSPSYVRLTIGSNFCEANGIELPNRGTARVDEYGNLYISVGQFERHKLYPNTSAEKKSVQCPKKMVMAVAGHFNLGEGKYALDFKPTAKPLTWQITGYRPIEKRNDQ